MTRSYLLQALLALSVATAFNIAPAMADGTAAPSVEAPRTPDQRQDARQDRRDDRQGDRREDRKERRKDRRETS